MMRQRTADFVRKIITVVLACLMLMVMLPSGWLFRRETAEISSDYLQRVYPSYTAFVRSSEPAITGNRLNPDVLWVGNGQESYVQLSLGEISHMIPEELSSAKLRFAITEVTGALPQEIRIAQLENTGWNTAMTYQNRPQGEETTLMTLLVTQGTNSVLEADLTAFVQNCLRSDRKTVTLHIYGADEGAVAFASERHMDGTLHPCLKLFWGTAVDTDPVTAAKSELKETTVVSAKEPDTAGEVLNAGGDHKLVVDDDHTAYVKFRMIAGNIRGVVAKATLILYAEETEGSAVLLPSLLENSSWNQSMTYHSRPQGKMDPFGSYRVELGTFALDVTQAVSEQFQHGAEEITFLLEGTGSMAFADAQAEAKKRPVLYIETSEDPNIVAAHETMVNLLKENLSADRITSDLCGSYLSEAGARATVDWEIYDAVSGEENSRYIAVNGGVTRPKWFEGEKTLRAVAGIQSGDCQLKRTLLLTLPPETAPELDLNRLENCLIIGNGESEETQDFAYVRGSRIKTRNVSGQSYTYRTLGEDGAMAINLRCDPDAKNILTVKLWEEEDLGRWYFSDPQIGITDPETGAKSGKLWIPMLLEADNTEQDAEGFLYASFEIPESYTRGKEYIRLCLFRVGDESETTDRLWKRAEEGRGIYAVTLKNG